MQQQLNPNIELAPSLTATLNPEVIDIVNEVGCAVKSDFPGLIVQLGKEEDIHRALSLEGSRFPREMTSTSQRMPSRVGWHPRPQLLQLSVCLDLPQCHGQCSITNKPMTYSGAAGIALLGT